MTLTDRHAPLALDRINNVAHMNGIFRSNHGTKPENPGNSLSTPNMPFTMTGAGSHTIKLQRLKHSVYYRPNPAAKDQALVDIGCGTGLLLKIVSHSYPEIKLHGCDITPAMITKARRALGCTADLQSCCRRTSSHTHKNSLILLSATALHSTSSAFRMHFVKPKGC